MRALAITSFKAAVAATVVAAATVGAPAALAATPAPAAVPFASQYSGSCTVSINATVLVRGQSLVITTQSAGTVVTQSLTVNSAPASIPVVPPGPGGVSTYNFNTSALELGAHTVTATCSNNTTQVLPFTITAAQASGIPAASGTTAGGRGSGLAFTGANAVVPLAALGAVLVLGGGGAIIAARRRRDDSA